MKNFLLILFSTLISLAGAAPLTFPGTKDRPGNGKHIVFLVGDEEYRSEESAPMLAKILSKHHGFKTTVLFSLHPEKGYIDPNSQKHMPGTEVLASADLLILGLRFRNLPEKQLQPIADYLNAGKPVFGFRTSTHAFRTNGNELGGIKWDRFGPDILGEGWAGHHGQHGMEGAKGQTKAADHPIMRNVRDIFAESDVYRIKSRKISRWGSAKVLLNGAVTENLLPNSPRAAAKSPMPAVWLLDYQTPNGKKGQAMCSTMGASCDLDNEGLRRLFINAAFFLTGLEVPEKTNVSYVDPFVASRYQFLSDEHYEQLNLKPEDFGYGKSPQTGTPLKSLIDWSVKRWTEIQEKIKASKDIPGPKIISTETSVVEQQLRRRRPKFHQPTSLKDKPQATKLPLKPENGESIVMIGNSLAERMTRTNHLESLIHANFPSAQLTVRNMGFPGHTPAYRPEAGTENPWAFPGGEKFRPEIARHLGRGHYPNPDEWLRILEADTIVAFFGFNESFDGLEGVANFRAELAAFVDHTLSRSYNTKKAPKLILATPISTENLPQYFLPSATDRNPVIKAYADAVSEVAKEKEVALLDLFTPTSQWSSYTINGVHLSDEGYAKLAPIIFQQLFGTSPKVKPSSLLTEAIADKNWHWKNDYRMVNGVHAYGARWAPYGNINYPEEIEKIRQMTVLRDENLWKIAQSKSSTLKVADETTRPLTPVKSNYRSSEKNGELTYYGEEEAMKKFTLPEGYQVSTFATEKEFPNLANPMQMRFDNRGRMWVSIMPSYPHYRPGDPKPNDKILIYEDVDNDGRADKETVWADGLSIPIGFDFADTQETAVYLTDGSHLVLLTDTDGDDRADKKEYLLDGFDPHDSHHSFSAFDTDNGGGLFMLEGRFLHSQVETPWGPQRMTDGGVWRWDHQSWKLERVMQTDVSNPWGIGFDEYGQNILNDASGGSQHWMAGYGIKMPHGAEMSKVSKFNFEHHARPTSGSEFIYSSHFPDEIQGDYVYGNTIGFLGLKQFKVLEEGPEILGNWRQDLIQSSDRNFRPADLEVAFDGSLYFLDWHNALIGHMQHSARDPNRSSTYGRIYRITYPSRPLVTPPKIAGADLTTLFENMKLPELQARKRSHRELRKRSAEQVIPAAKKFAAENASSERLILEALWATWGQDQPDRTLVEQCLAAKDHRVRSAAIRVVRHSLHLFSKPEEILLKAAQDAHPRPRIEALNAASWLGGTSGARILLTVASQPTDPWIRNSLNAAMLLLSSEVTALLEKESFSLTVDVNELKKRKLKGAKEQKNFLTKSRYPLLREDRQFRESYQRGRKVLHEEGSCATCHQESGLGLANIYPPLAPSEWVTGSKERLIKLTLHGLWGKIVVNGKTYDPAKGVPPMTAVGAMFNDQEVADVLTYVRNSWGNEADIVLPEEVAKIRKETADRKVFYKPEELLKDHPFPTSAKN